MKKLITPYCKDFGKPNITIKHFPDTESYVFIPKINSLKSKKVIIYQRLYPEPEKRLFELLLILSRVKKETKDIELFVPYLPYARQDKEHKIGEVVSADILCEILKRYGVKKLITYDCHFLPQPGIFTRSGLKIDNKSAGRQLIEYAKKYFGKEKFIIISPDQGSSYFIKNAQGYVLKKKRKKKISLINNQTHGDIHTMKGGEGAKEKNICILDDMISTGGTVLRAIEHLKTKGAKKIIVGSTHGVFSGKKIIEKILKKNCNQLFITNTIPNKNKKGVKIIFL